MLRIFGTALLGLIIANGGQASPGAYATVLGLLGVPYVFSLQDAINRRRQAAAVYDWSRDHEKPTRKHGEQVPDEDGENGENLTSDEFYRRYGYWR